MISGNEVRRADCVLEPSGVTQGATNEVPEELAVEQREEAAPDRIYIASRVSDDAIAPVQPDSQALAVMLMRRAYSCQTKFPIVSEV